MELISDEFFRALGHLLIAGIVYLAWGMASNNAKDGKYKTVLWKGFLWCAGIALLASITLGDPSCEEWDDPIRGGCVYYADDGYEPTVEQRGAIFVYLMTLLYIPVIIAAQQGKRP